MALREGLKQYLKYIQNTGGNASIAQFDEDWEPIGPAVRRELGDDYFVVNDAGKLELTEAGKKEIE